MAKVKNDAFEDWIVLDVIVKYSVKLLKCQYKENKQYDKMEIISKL